MKDVGSQRFQFKTPAEIKEELGGTELFRRNDNLLTYFNCPIEERNCSVSIPSASSSVKDSISPMRSDNFSSCEHPEIFKCLRDFTLPMLLGRIFSLQHPSRFKITRLFKFPIDGWTSTKLEQPFSFSFSRLELCKFGVLIRC
jgi:hypothetical protein